MWKLAERWETDSHNNDEKRRDLRLLSQNVTARRRDSSVSPQDPFVCLIFCLRCVTSFAFWCNFASSCHPQNLQCGLISRIYVAIDWLSICLSRESSSKFQSELCGESNFVIFFSPRFPLSCWLIAVEVFFKKWLFIKGFYLSYAHVFVEVPRQIWMIVPCVCSCSMTLWGPVRSS